MKMKIDFKQFVQSTANSIDQFKTDIRFKKDRKEDRKFQCLKKFDFRLCQKYLEYSSQRQN